MTGKREDSKKIAKSKDVSGMDHAARRGRPIGDHEARKAELLAAAISVIAKEGYANASLRRVADQAKYTLGTVNYYFDSKSDMIASVTESLFDYYDSYLLPYDDTISLDKVFEKWLTYASLSFFEKWVAMLQLIASASDEPGFRDIVQRRYAGYRGKLATIIRRAQDKGIVRNDINAITLADQLGAMGDGWLMMARVEPEKLEPKATNALIEATIILLRPPVCAHAQSAISL